MVIDLDVLIKGDQKASEESSKSSISRASVQENKMEEKGEVT
jgi:hypothetical protein